MLVGDAVDSQASHLVSGLLVSIAAGSFLYIALIEILPMELHKETTKLKHGIKLGVMIFGWAFMVMIAKFA
jgi:zinc transporter ZupT